MANLACSHILGTYTRLRDRILGKNCGGPGCIFIAPARKFCRRQARGSRARARLWLECGRACLRVRSTRPAFRGAARVLSHRHRSFGYLSIPLGDGARTDDSWFYSPWKCRAVFRVRARTRRRGQMPLFWLRSRILREAGRRNRHSGFQTGIQDASPAAAAMAVAPDSASMRKSNPC